MDLRLLVRLREDQRGLSFLILIRIADGRRFAGLVRAALLAVLALWIGAAAATRYEGRVVGVTDGDTLTLLDARKVQHKVRLVGIDAPERRQAFGTVARRHLSTRVFGRDVVIEATRRDRYGRLLGKVLIDGRDANLELLRAGLAWHYVRYARQQSARDRAIYAEAERAARVARRGLWRDSRPVPPWEFRRARR